MPNNGNDWNRNREGSIRNWNDYDERRNRENDYESDDYNRSERNYGNQGSSYGNAGNSNRDRSNERYSDWDSRGRYSGDMNRGSSNYPGEGRDWNRGDDWNRSSDWNRNRGYPGQGYDERFSNERNRENDRNWWNKTKDEVSSWFGDEDAERRRRMDEWRGEFRGKGPKGYTRSDERIKEDVNDSLSDDPQVDASDINVTVSSCEVTLTGTVKDRWQKRRAEDIAENVSGVKNVENRIKVGSSANANMGTTSSTGTTRSSVSST